MKKIGILGGTFNPPHYGHLKIAEALLGEFELDEIILLPSGLPPHKRSIKIASNEHRMEMLKILIEDNTRLKVSDRELKRSGYTYTVDTLTELQQTESDCIFYYIIGTDTLFHLTQWMRFEDVFRLTQFLCVPRPGDDPEHAKNHIRFLREKYGARIFLAKSCGPNISSTLLREKLAAGESLRDYVPPKLEEYIQKNGIFR